MAGKKAVKSTKPKVNSTSSSDDHAGGASLDDAFADDEGVDYAPTKPAKVKKKAAEEELDDELDEIERGVGELSVESGPVQVKGSKPITQLKKGNTIMVNGMKLEVDAHTMLIDHGSTKEMAIDAFDPKTDTDYQIRYFSDQVEGTLELYKLQEIMYLKLPLKTLQW